MNDGLKVIIAIIMSITFALTLAHFTIPQQPQSQLRVTGSGDSCGTLSTPNTIYTLTQNVSSTGTCFTVTASNVTLDCNGFTVNYSGTTTGYGVYANSANNFTVKNCFVNQTNASTAIKNAHAIYFYNSNYSTVYNNSVLTVGGTGSGTTEETNNYGAYIYWSDWTNVTNNTIKTNGSRGHGFRSEYSNNATIASNNITTHDYGAYALWNRYSNSTTLLSNNLTTYSRLGYGLFLHRCINNTITGNQINTSQVSGFLIYGNTITETNHTISATNLIEGYALNYSFNLQNTIYQNENWTNTYGEVICAFCKNVTYQNITMGNDGFVFSNSSNINLTRNTVTTNKGFGILFYPQSYNEIIDSNKITTSGSFEVALYLSDYVTANITNNNFVTTGSGARAIYLEWVSNTNVSNNTITTTGGLLGGSVGAVGITLTGDATTKSKNNNLSNNTIQTAGYFGWGVYLVFAPNNEISQNIITTTGQRGYGIYAANTNSSIFNRNNVSTSNDFGTGLRFGTDSYDNSFSNNIITTSGANGVGIYFLTRANNNRLFNTSVTTTNTTTPWALNFEDATNNTAVDSFFNAISTADVRSYGAGINHLLNTTFNKSDTLFAAASTAVLNVSWYVSVYVNDTAGNPFPAATVSVKNINGTTVASGLTNATGWVDFNVTEYTRNITGIYNETPHNITATFGIISNYSSATFDSSKTVTITVPPIVTTITGAFLNATRIATTCNQTNWKDLNKVIQHVNQTVDYGVMNITNAGNVVLNISMRLNNSIGSLRLCAGSTWLDGNCSNASAVFLNGSYQVIGSINVGASSMYWFWLNCSNEKVSRSYSVQVNGSAA